MWRCEGWFCAVSCVVIVLRWLVWVGCWCGDENIRQMVTMRTLDRW